MTDTTANLDLPFIVSGQQQKHITHNEALQALDALVQIGVADRDLGAPPSSPDEGVRYIVGTSASGAWTGSEGMIAAFQNGAWVIYQPLPGWVAWVEDEETLLTWTGGEWTDVVAAGINPAIMVGINTVADDINKLAVKSDAVLLTHDDVTPGSGDVQLKINKDTPSDTASVLFQSGWSGRAEVGLTGEDALHLKVSADGVSWNEALNVNPATGSVTFDNAPLTVNGGAGTTCMELVHEGSTGGVFQATRFADSGGAPVFFGRKARGSLASPTAVQSGDSLLGFRGYGYDGSQFVVAFKGAAFLLQAAEDWSETAYGTEITFFTTANGTNANALERLRIANDGAVQMAGANTVISADRHLQLRSYPVSGLPSAANAGELIYVADEAGGATVAFSDGADWRRTADRAVVS